VWQLLDDGASTTPSLIVVDSRLLAAIVASGWQLILFLFRF